MRTSNDFGMVWWAVATAALGICVPAQEAAVWNAHEEEKFIAAIQDAIDYTMTGEASPTQNLTETPDPVNFVWEGLRTQGGSVVNTGVLSQKVSVSADATMRLHVREFKSTPESFNAPWTMNHWNVPNLTGDGLELVPIFNYTCSQEVILLATGITVDGGTGETAAASTSEQVFTPTSRRARRSSLRRINPCRRRTKSRRTARTGARRLIGSSRPA